MTEWSNRSTDICAGTDFLEVAGIMVDLIAEAIEGREWSLNGSTASHGDEISTVVDNDRDL